MLHSNNKITADFAAFNLDEFDELDMQRNEDEKGQKPSQAAEDNDLQALMFSLDQVEFEKIDGADDFDPTKIQNQIDADPLSFEPLGQLHEIRRSLLDNDEDFKKA